MDTENVSVHWGKYVTELGKNRAKIPVSCKRKKNHGERLVFTGQPVACQFYLNFITLQIGKVRF